MELENTTKIAYTIGRTITYNKGIKEPGGVKKLGREEQYEGGWVWSTIQQAKDFINYQMEQFEPAWRPIDFSVYELCLPNGWDIDISKLKVPGTLAYCLLHDAQIIRAMTPIDEFVEYVWSFYGTKQLYSIPGLTKIHVIDTVNEFFSGKECIIDSIDRESIRDILLQKLNIADDVVLGSDFDEV
jgi:hypothetical protein